MIFGFGPGHSSSSRIARNREWRWQTATLILKAITVLGLLVGGYLAGFNPSTGEPRETARANANAD
ncbi:MAG: hypothetical protein AAF577_17600 [Pseudomonadota bacterium]